MLSLLRTTRKAPITGSFCSQRKAFHKTWVQWQLRRHQSSDTPKPIENLNVSHSRFLAEESRTAKWTDDQATPGNDGVGIPAEDYDSLSDGKGKLSPTSSHLLKLILPINRLRIGQEHEKRGPPTVFLLHPSQPLSHIGRLVSASLGPENAKITFHCLSPKGLALEWSDSTDLGDFIRDAARVREFTVNIQGDKSEERTLQVEVPTFADRTRFLRRRLETIQDELKSMEALKKQCDYEAHRGARKMALGGLGMLVVYWGTVTRLTFWDLGWDIMEPVTYLSGLSMVILGYLWFLHQGREVSYSSVLHTSISTRRQALYKSRGFDIDRWADLIAEEKSVRKEIGKIADDYDERRWTERNGEREEQDKKTAKEIDELRADEKKAETLREDHTPPQS
ncbi:hypothetical protein BC835DRAFT_1283189 [Cytidiella melzeri]|nr:hypothetical protein BC835DRAFT_1283189 [Cytidiella melzeri]